MRQSEAGACGKAEAPSPFALPAGRPSRVMVSSGNRQAGHIRKQHCLTLRVARETAISLSFPPRDPFSSYPLAPLLPNPGRKQDARWALYGHRRAKSPSLLRGCAECLRGERRLHDIADTLHWCDLRSLRGNGRSLYLDQPPRYRHPRALVRKVLQPNRTAPTDSVAHQWHNGIIRQYRRIACGSQWPSVSSAPGVGCWEPIKEGV